MITNFKMEEYEKNLLFIAAMLIIASSYSAGNFKHRRFAGGC